MLNDLLCPRHIQQSHTLFWCPVPSRWFQFHPPPPGPPRGRHGSVGLRGRVLRRGLRQEHPGRLEMSRGGSHEQQLGLAAGGRFFGWGRGGTNWGGFSSHHSWPGDGCFVPRHEFCIAFGSSLFLTPTSPGTWPTPAAAPDRPVPGGVAGDHPAQSATAEPQRPQGCRHSRSCGGAKEIGEAGDRDFGGFSEGSRSEIRGCLLRFGLHAFDEHQDQGCQREDCRDPEAHCWFLGPWRQCPLLRGGLQRPLLSHTVWDSATDQRCEGCRAFLVQAQHWG